MQSKPRGRRKFLKQAALASLAVGSAGIARAQAPESPAEAPPVASDLRAVRAYGQRSRFETAVRETAVPQSHNPIQEQQGIITPASLHYVVSHGYDPPDIDPRQHRLLIHGMVDRPLIFTLEELKRLPSVSRIHFLECAGNTSPVEGRETQTSIQYTHGWTSCSVWTGVALSMLLKEAGVQKNATWILAEGSEAGKHTKSIPIEKALDDVLVAYGQNGEAVRPQQGYPLRLVVPGWEGINNVKWLRRIKVVDEPYFAKSESTGYPVLRPGMKGKAFWYNFEMGPKSVITYPSFGQKLAAKGYHQIAGLAWSGGGAIRRVEVSVDGGKNWKDAELQGPILSKAHTRFIFPWIWNGEETLIQSRSTDERGIVQPPLAEFAKFWGVEPGFFETTTMRVNHFNAIYPWKVTRDGSIQNGLFS